MENSPIPQEKPENTTFNLKHNTLPEFATLYTSIIGDPCPITPIFELYLRLDDPKFHHLLTSVTGPFPSWDIFGLKNITSSEKLVKQILTTKFPKKLKEFRIGYESELSSIENYFDDVLEVGKKVTESFDIWNFRLSSQHIVTLFGTLKHISHLNLFSCLLDLEEPPEFGEALTETNLRQLDLSFWGDPERGDWKENHEHFKNLIIGLGKSEDMRQSLEWLKMDDEDFDEIKVRDILDKNGFTKVKVYVLV